MKLTACKARPLLIVLVMEMALTGAAQNITVVNMISRSSSNETHQDSEPNLAVNPANPLQMAGSAFTVNPPSVPCGAGAVPIYLSADGGMTWTLCSIVPVNNHDITLRFGGTSNVLYVSWIDGGFLVNTNILRVTPFPTPTGLTVLQSIKNRRCFFGICNIIDQPYVEAATVLAGPGTGSDRVYVGENDLGHTSDTGSVNQSLDAATAAPPAGFNLPPNYVDARPTCGQDAPSVRPAIHSSGVVYAAFLHYSQCSSPFAMDVVVVRDDHWGGGGTPYSDLKGADGKPGVAVVSGAANTFARSCVGSPGPACMGTERIGSALSIAVDPNNASNVWIAWADGADASHYTLHVRQSADKGSTWNEVRAVTPATNPALTINSQGVIGFLYQKFVDPGTCARPQGDTGTACWETHLETSVVGAPWSDRVLANTPDGPAQFDPSIGDYVHVLAVGKTLYGIFSANNFPEMANFPQGVTYQRNVDFSAQRLLDVNSTTAVGISVDPFFFSVTPNPCQGFVDTIQALQDQIDTLSNLLGDPGFSQATQRRIRQLIGAIGRILRSEQAQLKQCQLQHP